MVRPPLAPTCTVRLAILVVTLLLIAVQQLPGIRLNRPAASLLGAVAMVTIGGLPLRDAYAAIDLDVMVFLLGVLILTGALEVGGFFGWAAAWVVRLARSPRTLLAAVIAASGLLSAFFVNDTVCLVLTPLVLMAVRSLRLRALPFLLAVAMASNVGSAMTPTGNPQNMLIGVASGIHYARFVAVLALPSVGGLLIVYAVIAWVHRRDLVGSLQLATSAPVGLSDRVLVAKTLLVFAGALVAWLLGGSLPLVAIAGAALLFAIANRDPTPVLARVEWSLLLFFGALFVVMRGVQDLPVFTALTSAAGARLTGAALHDATVVSAAMLVLSNLVSNVPAVILWIPVVQSLAHASFVWLVMAMSSTFAGNLTIVGSMANLIVAERAESRGERINFWDYLRVGVPVTVATLLWGVLIISRFPVFR